MINKHAEKRHKHIVVQDMTNRLMIQIGPQTTIECNENSDTEAFIESHFIQTEMIPHKLAKLQEFHNLQLGSVTSNKKISRSFHLNK